MKKLYSALATKLDIIEKGNHVNLQEQCLQNLQDKYFPYGSGFDNKIKLDRVKSTPKKLIIPFSYHCMNDNGYYDGWIHCELIITPSLLFGFNMKINWKGYKGKYKFILEDYFQDVWMNVLLIEIPLNELSIPINWEKIK